MPLDDTCYLRLATCFSPLATSFLAGAPAAYCLQLATCYLPLATCYLLLENNTFYQFSTATAQFQTKLISIMLSLAESLTELGTAPAPSC